MNERNEVMCYRVTGRTVSLAGVLREGLPEDVTFEQRPAWRESTSPRKIWGRKSLPGGTSQCKGSVVGVLCVFKEQKEAEQWGLQ